MLIKNGNVVTSSGIKKIDILTDGEKISALAAAGNIPEKTVDKILDLAGLYVLPGIMDPHVHFRDPGHTYKEDFATGSLSAAAGGVTTVFDMPNNMPRIVGKEELEEKLSAIKNKAYVDYALYGLLTSTNIDKIPELIDGGIRGFKCLMGISAMNTPTGRDVDIWRAARVLHDMSIPISVHAEDTQIVDSARDELRAKGRKDVLAHMLSHPVISETLAVERAIMAAEDVGGRIHIAHISSGETVDLVRRAKNRGVNVSCEVGPHNLFFSEEDYARKGTSLFMNPPVRSKEDRDALICGIQDGTIDMIATDHAPHSEEEKSMDNGVFAVKSGFCGVETSVSVMLTLVNRGLLSLEQYAKIGSENVAKLFNLYPRKGCIQVGSDADFTIVDMNCKYVVKKEDLHSRSKITAFDGEELTGKPVYTIMRGRVVMEKGKIIGSPAGKYLN